MRCTYRCLLLGFIPPACLLWVPQAHAFLPVFNGSIRTATQEEYNPRWRVLPTFFEHPSKSSAVDFPTASSAGEYLEEEEGLAVEVKSTVERDEKQINIKRIENGLISAKSAIVWLNAVAIIWGSQHAFIKMVVDDGVPPGTLLLLRFGLAAVLASPFTPLPFTEQQEGESDNVATVWRWGLEMGLWMFLGFLLQAIGLQYTTAQKSAFLLYLNVKFVPFLAALLYQRSISWATWASAATAFTGTALLAGATNLNVGDAWSIAAALVSALFIVRLEAATAAVPNAAQLNSASLWVVTGLAALWSTSDSQPSVQNLWESASSITPSSLLALVYLGAVTTAGANWIQTKAQRYVAAERAAVVYALDPVYGAVFAYGLLGEELTSVAAWVGAGLIVLAAGANAMWDVTDSDKSKKTSNNK